jgi:diguanylate cyclase (GGDEF)-like protein/PAS domain S-box-containing protein
MTFRHPDRTTMGVVALVVVFGAWMLGGFGGEQVTRTVSNVGTVLITVAAGMACLARAVHSRGRMRAAWTGIGLGTLSYALGDTVWTWIETIQGRQVPSPGLPDVFFLCMVPLTAAGLLLVPVARQSLANRIRSIVDGLMIACSLLLISWIAVIGPLIAEGADTTLGLYVVLAYPVGDIVLVTIVLYMLALLRRGGHGAGPLVLIGAAMLVIATADSVYAFVALHDEYVSGGLLDVAWVAAFALVLLAARSPDSGHAPLAYEHESAPDQRPFAMLVPYAVVLVALVSSVLFSAVTGRTDVFFGGSRSVLIILIIVRQLLTLLENGHLTRQLEARVAKRSTELQASEARFRALVLQSSESVAVIDADTRIFFQSESVERIFGYPPDMLLGLTLVDVVGRKAGPAIAACIESIRDTELGVAVLEVPLRHHSGSIRLAEMTITNLLHDPVVAGYVLNTRDIHDARELQEQLMHEAYHDSLTGLASRALFTDRVTEALDRSVRADDVAILVLDLDGFKEINDSLGHAAGDALLIQVADRLRAAVREGDTVARFGGDEFGILIESLAARADAEAVAGRIAAALEDHFEVGGRDLRVAFSIGLASGADAEDIEQLVRNADLAMYRAKSAGGAGLAAYDPKMLSGLLQRLELEADLRLALERDELALHYQPTVDLRTGEITGFEALVRWHHPTRGIVSPLDFIGIAEATGLIVPMGRWVLAEACRQAVAWGAGSTRRLRMAVNVSVRQFEHGDLSATVAEVLAETGLPVDQLCLEMTESVLLTDTDENLTQLERLKALGVTLAMDDFGTGYSSLAYLRRYPMDILKIDRSFVDRLGGELEDEALVRTIVRLGKSLGMTTVAEGIEEKVQLQSLRELGCDVAQGYLLSRPVPASEAGRLLTEGLAATVPA